MADQVFSRSDAFPVIICRTCKHGVRPQHIVGHLTGSPHRLSIAAARTIAQEVQGWNRVSGDPDQIWLPTQVDEPIRGLPIYSDGILCIREPDCGYVCRNIKAIKNHWRQEHQWAVPRPREQPTAATVQAAEDAIQGSMQSVVCQRLFHL